MTPEKSLVRTGYNLINPGKEYLVYLPTGVLVSVDLSGATGNCFHVSIEI